MGVDDVIDEGDEEVVGIGHSTTVGDLVDEYGEGAVARALSYMRSLERADRNYRESAESERLKEGYEEAGVTDEDGEIQEVTERWEEAMEGGGLDINE